MNCLKCKKPIPEDSEFCPYCGNVVDRTMLPLCGNCGRAVPEDSEFCPYCGTAVLQDLSTKCSKCGKEIPDDVEPPVNAIQKEKKKKPWIWLVPVVVILILAGIAFGGDRDGKNSFEGPVEDPPTTTLNDAAEAVLYLEVYDTNDEFMGSASGFLVNNQTTLVTSYHVVQDAHQIIAWTADGEQYVEANILSAYDEVADLAVLNCEAGLDIEPLHLENSDTAVQGSPVYAVGYPLGLANTLSDGIISARYKDEYKNDILQVTAAISEGNSGGPLLNENGHVVGVISAYYVDGQNLNIGVTSNMLRSLLNGDSSPINLKYWRNRPDMPGEESSNANDIDTEGISGSVDNSTSEIEPLSLAEEWATVTLENLQGRWVGIDLNGDTEVIEIQGNYGYNYYLTVNGEVDYSSYMGEGVISIIDRSSFGKCPEVSFSDKTTFYISCVTSTSLYNAGYGVYYYKQN